MKLDRFINRPVLSTVISVLIGYSGYHRTCYIAGYAISGYCTSYGAGTCHLYRCELHSCIEFGHRAVGRPDKRCGEHDVYPVISIQ